MKAMAYAFIACLLFGLSGCGGGNVSKSDAGGNVSKSDAGGNVSKSDAGGNASKIIGTWKLPESPDTWEFTSSGTVIEKEPGVTTVGNYEINGDKIKIILGRRTRGGTIKSLTDKELVIGSDEDTIKLTRK